MSRPIYGPLFKYCRTLARLFYRPYETDFANELKGPVVYVGHHQNLFGPFIIYHSFPIDVRCWILHVFLEKKACFHHYRNYTFQKRFGWGKWLSNSLAFLLSHFVPRLLNSGKGIPVYRGTRQIMQTLKQSLDALKNGESIAIFPSIDYKSNEETIGAIYEGFLSIEKYYFKETGQHLSFVPVYVSKAKRKIFVGEPITFSKEVPFAKERKNVSDKLRLAINELQRTCG